MEQINNILQNLISRFDETNFQIQQIFISKINLTDEKDIQDAGHK
ncbi:hypothetical protein AYI70_g518, partial [Smittium culicis]